MANRRQFLTRAILLPSLICKLHGQSRRLLAAQTTGAPAYDLLIRGGRLVDPSQGLSGETSVAIRQGKVARIAANIAESEASRVFDARGLIVTPGLVDVHVHVYDGVAPLGIPADPNCIAKGATTVVDAGSSGAHTFPGLRQYVIRAVETRVFALLNISVIGQSTLSPDNPFGELLDLRYANPKLAIRTIEQNRDVILGVKIRLTRNIAGEHDLQALALAREAADAVNLPLMVHIGGAYSPLPKILAMLGKGDLVTHTFHGREGGILDERGRVLNEVRKAVENGVLLDVGHGAGSFSFGVAEKAFSQGVLPGTISSDVHQYNVNGPVYDLATTLSKFMHMGMSLEDVVRRATSNPARAFAFPSGTGSLKEGSTADAAVFELREGPWQMVDSLGEKRPGKYRLRPVATFKSGRPYGNSVTPI
ncbi:MAG: amidohydrolase/deacetylase family metallohydrolase [Bryobacterales bacterium]|nr:amidohydrolase/deacetylase family metallohydrolase [Bryobacterales bacterium]